MLFLPSDSAVYTSIRDPVGRLLSAYEFAAELAIRDSTRASPRRAAVGANVETTNVWPWSYLQPHFLADITARTVRLIATVELCRGLPDILHVLLPRELDT
jgi:hypothetical protein